MKAINQVTNDTVQEIFMSWENMNRTERAEAIREAAIEKSVTESTVYRWIKYCREYGSRGVSKRSDKGRPRILNNELMRSCITKIMGLKSLDPSKPNKRISNPNKAISTARAIEILENMEEIPMGVISARTANRWASVYGTTVKNICAPTPAIKLITEHPNHVHVIDFSVCEQYYLRNENGKIAILPWSYKNKPNEAKMKIWAFALIDHYSTVKFIKYFLSPGESSAILYKGLLEAWTKKDDSQFPFHGAPRYLFADKGSALRSERIQNLLTALNVKIIYHKPGNPRAKGMVESSFKHLQVDFEAELRLHPAKSIEELNDRVYNWLINHNWKTKQGENNKRFSKWQEITQEQLLEMPEKRILNKVTASHELRTVDAYCMISINKEKYGVPAPLVGKKVRVWNNINGGISVQDIQTGEMHSNIEIKTTVFGTYNSHKKSDARRAQEKAINIAAELKKKITLDDLRREIPNVHAMPAKGTPITIESDLVLEECEEYDSIYQAKKAIADELRINLGNLDPWLIEEIENSLKKTLNKEKVFEIARYIEGFLNNVKDAM